MCRIISIEGNIGSGKSTFMAKMKEAFSERTDICFLDEPVDSWNQFKDNNGSILEHYYQDQSKWGFTFQMLAYISRLSILRKALSQNYKYIVTERSLFTDKHVFCKMLYDRGIIHPIQYQIYQAWFDEFHTEHEYVFVYLRTDPTIAHERVQKRNRKGETIPISYLQDCHEYHEKWLSDSFVLDANLDESMTIEWISQIKDGFLQ
jgi:deoxyadenosine/deoxycytidine kinase